LGAQSISAVEQTLAACPISAAAPLSELSAAEVPLLEQRGQDGVSADLKRRLKRLLPLLWLLAVVGITVRLYWNLANTMDLVLADEAYYLGAGSRFLYKGQLPSFQFSPPYAGWYAIHLAVFSDPVLAYHAQVYVVVVLTAALMYVYLRLIDIAVPLAALGAVLWIAQPAYITLDWSIGWPRPYHFAFLLFLIGAIALRKLKFEGGLPLLLVGASFLLLVMAVRNEYALSLAVFICLVAFLSRSRWHQPGFWRPTSGVWSAGFFALVVSLTTWMGLRGRVPGQAERSWDAFTQHFITRLVGSSPDIKLSDWYGDGMLVVAQTFPGAHSLIGAALANPQAFGRFEAQNFLTAPRILYAYLALGPYELLKALPLCLTFVWISLTTFTNASLRRCALVRAASALGPYVLAGAAAAVPATLITPKITYFLPLLFVLFAGGLKWLSNILESEPEFHKSAVALSAALLMLALVVIRSPFDNSIGAGKPVYSEMIEIRSILERSGVGGARILQIGGTGFSAFLPHGLSETVDPYDRHDTERFWDFVRREDVEAVLVDNRLRSSRHFRDDSDFAALLLSPDRFGWIAAPVGTRGDVFYLYERRNNSLRQ
jgi:hypothetical protein